MRRIGRLYHTSQYLASVGILMRTLKIDIDLAQGLGAGVAASADRILKILKNG